MDLADRDIQSRRFLEKVTQIVRNNFTNEQFSVELLADQYGISRSQLYKRIKKLTGKSANQFIREVRLEEAFDMLQREEASVSEIAFRVGFNSSSYFATCFKDRYGYTPGETKHHRNGDNKVPFRSKTNSTRRNALILGLFALIIALVVIISGTSNNQSPDARATLAVLPFEDLSPEGNNGWFCSGISIDISDQLSRLGQLRTISKTSTGMYRETLKSIPEISRELGANYFLEGGVREFNDHIIINVQLVDKDGITLWSESFNEEPDQLFRIQQEVASRVVELLKITLSNEQNDYNARIPTQDIEAYKLLLKGREINASAIHSNWNFDEAIRYFEKALLLDPNYSDAYAELAYAQLYSFFISNHSDSAFLEKSKTSINKALTLNPQSAQAYVTKAIIEQVVYDKDDKAAENLEKAISFDPNNALANFEYAWYFKEKLAPDYKKYLQYASIAAELNPLSTNHQLFKLDALLRNDKIKEAEAYLSSLTPTLNNYQQLYRKAEIQAFKYKDRSRMLDVYWEALKKDSLDPIIYNRIAAIYDWVLNNDHSAAIYYEKAYSLDESYVYLYHNMLCEGGEFEKAMELSQTENFKSIKPRENQLLWLFYYYFHKKDYVMALEITEDSLMAESYEEKAMVLARMGRHEEANIIVKTKPLVPQQKATIYAMMGNRDSMYHYLSRPGINLMFNSRHAYDPYRNEKRYQDIQRKHLIPTQTQLDKLIQDKK